MLPVAETQACLRAMQARAGTVYAPGLNYAPQPLPARTPARPPMDGMAAPASFGAQARLLSIFRALGFWVF